MAGSVHKYQTKKGEDKWMYMLDTGKNENGKRKQKKKSGFKSEKEAKKALTLAESEVYQGTYIEPSKVSYGEYVFNWLNNRKLDLHEQTYTANKMYIKKYIIPHLGKVSLTDLRKDHIQKFINTMCEIERKDGKKGYAPKTIKKAVEIIRTSLGDAVEDELIKKNVSKKVTLPKQVKKEMTVWTHEEVDVFKRVAEKDKLYCAFYLALATGMRQGEILGLRWKDIDFDNKTLTIHQVLGHNGKVIYSGAKNKTSERTIPLTELTIKALRIQKAIVAEDKMKNRKSYQDLGLVICTSLGTPQSPRNLLRSFYRLIKQADVPKITFHNLRDTHATLLLSKGVNVKVISERLGHSSIRVTLDTYSHILPTMQKDALDKLENMIGL